MEQALNKWFVILNPTSGNNASKRLWPEIKRLLAYYEFDFDYAFTEYERHSTELTYKALELSYKKIICVGGDGTLHNIVNGIMTQNYFPTPDIHVGVIPIGTGNDWVRTFKISRHIESAIKTIKRGRVLTQDIGVIDFITGTSPSVYFTNLAGAGFDGFVVSKVTKMKYLGKIAYLLGALISIFSFKNFNSKVTIDNEQVYGKTLMILIGLCRYSGGGMQLTNKPNPFDGKFDVSIAQNLNKLEIIKNIPILFNGKITLYKKVKTYKTCTLKVVFKNETLPYIQADGELIGKGNFEVKIIEKAFSFYA